MSKAEKVSECGDKYGREGLTQRRGGVLQRLRQEHHRQLARVQLDPTAARGLLGARRCQPDEEPTLA